MDNERDAFYAPEQDDAAAAELAGERIERTLSALYHAAMLGLEEAELRHLCNECGGITYADLQAYTPPILRREQEPDEATMSLPF
jgi:hypothetical protein